MEDNVIVRLDHVSKFFTVRTSIFGGRKVAQVIGNLSLSIKRGGILCLVGESGCGKTTTGKLIVGLARPTSGKVLFEGQDIWDMDGESFRRYRKSVQIIHQDPYSSLNPMHRVYNILSAPLLRHRIVKDKSEAEKKVLELLEKVDLTPPEDFIYKHPHQLSGGQRQRVVIARSLTLDPKFIVADEAVSMLDVSIRLSIIDILRRLKSEANVTFLFITHDLAMAKYFGWEGRIAVMYLGRIVEIGLTPRVIENPLHPYTKALLMAIPEADPEITNLLNLPPGCTFNPRCPFWIEGLCEKQEPSLFEPEKDHYVACHLFKGNDRPTDRTSSI